MKELIIHKEMSFHYGNQLTHGSPSQTSKTLLCQCVGFFSVGCRWFKKLYFYHGFCLAFDENHPCSAALLFHYLLARHESQGLNKKDNHVCLLIPALTDLKISFSAKNLHQASGRNCSFSSDLEREIDAFMQSSVRNPPPHTSLKMPWG